MIFGLIESVNGSRLFAGIMMLLLNIGSKHIVQDISKTQEEWFNNQLLRRLVIFAICFVTTRDVITSVILTGGFIVFTSGLFADKSPISLLPKTGTSDPFGFIRTLSTPGLPPVQNSADDRKTELLFTT
jgi:hypothetical protein